MSNLLFIYFGIMNILAFTFYGLDKYKAKHKLWRIPESTLLLLALFGGSLGALAGMYCFRHKTQKIKFTVGVPCILILQGLLWMYLH